MQQGIILNAIEWLALVAVIGLLMTIVKTLIGKQAKDLEKRLAEGTKKMEDTEKRVDDVEQNYLKQFTEVRKTITDGNEKNIREMMSMEIRLKECFTENFVMEKVCAVRHAELREVYERKEP